MLRAERQLENALNDRYRFLVRLDFVNSELASLFEGCSSVEPKAHERQREKVLKDRVAGLLAMDNTNAARVGLLTHRLDLARKFSPVRPTAAADAPFGPLPAWMEPRRSPRLNPSRRPPQVFGRCPSCNQLANSRG